MHIGEGKCRVENITVGSDCHIANGMRWIIANAHVILNAKLKPINVRKIYEDKFGQLINKIQPHLF